MFIAGGVGTAPVYPQVKWLSEQGVKADVIVGAKAEEYMILEEMEKVAGKFIHVLMMVLMDLRDLLQIN